jgi:DNA-binding transcriptional LysR family regulator
MCADTPNVTRGQGADTFTDMTIAELFEANGLGKPKAGVLTQAVPLRINLLETGKFIAALPKSIADPLKVLPIEVPVRPWTVAIITLKNRTLNRVTECFIEHVRDFA